MERSSGAIRTAYDIQIDGRRVAGRPKQTWEKLTEKDCREWQLTTVDPQERSTWRSGVRSAMRAASQLPGKEPTDVDDAPAPDLDPNCLQRSSAYNRSHHQQALV